MICIDEYPNLDRLCFKNNILLVIQRLWIFWQFRHFYDFIYHSLFTSTPFDRQSNDKPWFYHDLCVPSKLKSFEKNVKISKNIFSPLKKSLKVYSEMPMYIVGCMWHEFAKCCLTGKKMQSPCDFSKSSAPSSGLKAFSWNISWNAPSSHQLGIFYWKMEDMYVHMHNAKKRSCGINARWQRLQQGVPKIVCN